jgi:hypothetical protein
VQIGVVILDGLRQASIAPPGLVDPRAHSGDTSPVFWADLFLATVLSFAFLNDSGFPEKTKLTWPRFLLDDSLVNCHKDPLSSPERIRPLWAAKNYRLWMLPFYSFWSSEFLLSPKTASEWPEASGPPGPKVPGSGEPMGTTGRKTLGREWGAVEGTGWGFWA